MIYLDNAATTWPKPEETIAAIEDCLRHAGANPGRGGHKMSLAAGRLIYETRQLLAGLFNAGDPAQVVFTGNATESMNLALKGFLKPGDHVITSSMEHNSVARPLYVLQGMGVEVTELLCSPRGELDPCLVVPEVRKNTRAVVLLHASNVTGTVLPITEIGQIARERGLCFMVDAAQTAGYLDIDVAKMNVDILAFTGHKSLYGPQGTGGLYIRKGIELEPLEQGGTGTSSESPRQPEDMPDKFESGTPNSPGIAGLGAGIRFILAKGLPEIRKHEETLVSRFLDGLSQIKNIELYGPAGAGNRVPVVSLNIKGQDSSEIAFIMDTVYGIACRSGLHCAPGAHRTMGTLDRGAVRFSFSLFNTEEEVDRVLEALDAVVSELS